MTEPFKDPLDSPQATPTHGLATRNKVESPPAPGIATQKTPEGTSISRPTYANVLEAFSRAQRTSLLRLSIFSAFLVLLLGVLSTLFGGSFLNVDASKPIKDEDSFIHLVAQESGDLATIEKALSQGAKLQQALADARKLGGRRIVEYTLQNGSYPSLNTDGDDTSSLRCIADGAKDSCPFLRCESRYINASYKFSRTGTISINSGPQDVAAHKEIFSKYGDIAGGAIAQCWKLTPESTKAEIFQALDAQLVDLETTLKASDSQMQQAKKLTTESLRSHIKQTSNTEWTYVVSILNRVLAVFVVFSINIVLMRLIIGEVTFLSTITKGHLAYLRIESSGRSLEESVKLNEIYSAETSKADSLDLSKNVDALKEIVSIVRPK